MQNYLLCDEDIGGVKSTKAKELGFVTLVPSKDTFLFGVDLHFLSFLQFLYFSCSTPFLAEDGLFDMIRASNKKALAQEVSKKSVEKVATSPPKKTADKAEMESMPCIAICLNVNCACG